MPKSILIVPKVNYPLILADSISNVVSIQYELERHFLIWVNELFFYGNLGSIIYYLMNMSMFYKSLNQKL